MERLDPEKNRFNLFIVDGASNLQGAGKVVEDVLHRVQSIHGSEHVLDLFFDDIEKITEINVIELYDTSSIFFYH